ncbi:hypothetical protein TNCV_1153801 [Trichonephila clavipes]|nr:hypothetical protein TNCV_1153801 [Trichonephila clavipes]
MNFILELLPKPGDDTLGDSKFLGYFRLGTSTFQSSNNSTTVQFLWDSELSLIYGHECKSYMELKRSSQLNNDKGRWSAPTAMHVQRFVSLVLPDRPF